MTTNQGAAGLQDTVFDAIEDYASMIRPPVYFIIFTTVFTALLAFLLVALSYFSKVPTCRQPIFILNICALLFGVASGVLWVHITVREFLFPRPGPPATQIGPVIGSSETLAGTVIILWTQWFSECILILRLVIVFQPGTKTNAVALLAFPIGMKLLRFSMLIVGLARMIDLSKSWTIKATYIFELADNFYVSGMFLCKLNQRVHITKQFTLAVGSDVRLWSFRNKLRSLFWIAATGFVFPVVLGLCSIVIIFTNPGYFVIAYLRTANMYSVLISTALATLWRQLPDDTKSDKPPARAHGAHSANLPCIIPSSGSRPDTKIVVDILPSDSSVEKPPQATE